MPFHTEKALYMFNKTVFIKYPTSLSEFLGRENYYFLSN